MSHAFVQAWCDASPGRTSSMLLKHVQGLQQAVCALTMSLLAWRFCVRAADAAAVAAVGAAAASSVSSSSSPLPAVAAVSAVHRQDDKQQGRHIKKARQREGRGSHACMTELQKQQRLLGVSTATAQLHLPAMLLPATAIVSAGTA
jgi:hypothetical protein